MHILDKITHHHDDEKKAVKELKENPRQNIKNTAPDHLTILGL